MTMHPPCTFPRWQGQGANLSPRLRHPDRSKGELDAEGHRWGHDPEDDAVHDLIHFVLSRLTVALMALGLASAPLSAAALEPGPDPGPSIHGVQAAHASDAQPDHRHEGASKPHAAGQICCHPGCIMAVVPVLTSATQGLPLSEAVPIPPDLTPAAAMPLGIDRPPKRA
jgi:hypothetical protein